MFRFAVIIGQLVLIVGILNCTQYQEKKLSEGEMKEKGEKYAKRRAEMVAHQIKARGVKDKLVLQAMGKVPREKFVPLALKPMAYFDQPLPIGEGQTISQPYIVALMTELMGLKGGEKVLEIGTGSGYQAAILAEIAAEVYSIEIVKPLADKSRTRLENMGYRNVTVRCGDGYQGWPEQAPFDATIVTAAPEHIPQPLVDQLKVGGRLVIPVGDWYQELVLITKGKKGITKKKIIPVRFVPMTGEAQEREKEKE